MKIIVTQKITYLEAKKIQENQPEITFAKVVQSLNTKPETKETSTQFNEKDSVIKANSKVIAPKPKPKSASTHQSRPPTKSQNSSQTQPTKASGSQQRSRSRTADSKGKKMEKKKIKIKIKNRIHTVKGRRPIRSSWSIGSIPSRAWS